VSTDRIAQFWPGCAILVVAVLVVYLPVVNHQFVNFDDGPYVYENSVVRAGLHAEGIGWALRSAHAANWHPLTWLSHMLDVSLFGTWAGGHHLSSVLLHALSAVLLFATLATATGSSPTSLLVALLFAIHPLHVESVAWVAERKDVLSTLLMLTASWVFCRQRRVTVTVTLLLCASLLAKQMYVTAPLLFLLLDHWPLGQRRTWQQQLRDKAPLALVALAAVGLAVFAQSRGGTLASFAPLPLTQRLGNAITSYAQYLLDTLWPAGLAPFYPHPEDRLPWIAVIGSTSLVLGVSLWAWRLRHTASWFIAGWGWYAISLLPVIGVIQIGSQARADRYTYAPLIGIFWIAVLTAERLADRLRVSSRLRLIAASLVIASLSFVARRQVSHWKDSVTLWTHTLAVTPDNSLAHTNLASALIELGQTAPAEEHLRRAVALEARDEVAPLLLGRVLIDRGAYNEAIAMLRRATRAAPHEARAWYFLGDAQTRAGQFDPALEAFERSARLTSDPAPWIAWGSLLVDRDRSREAVEVLREGLRRAPRSAVLHHVLIEAWLRLGEHAAALAAQRAAEALGITIDPALRSQLEAYGQAPDAARGTPDELAPSVPLPPHPASTPRTKKK
jgi:tetratricopeptide (TPR) repeat protein